MMVKRISIARIARLLGVSRSTLQRSIRRGDLDAYEGKVYLEDLRKHFPALFFNQSPLLERLQFIKDSAFAERVKTTVSPPTETLERQIRRLTVQLNIERASAHKYQALIEAILDKIMEINRSEDIDQRYALDEFSAWLADRFND